MGNRASIVQSALAEVHRDIASGNHGGGPVGISVYEVDNSVAVRRLGYDGIGGLSTEVIGEADKLAQQKANGEPYAIGITGLPPARAQWAESLIRAKIVELQAASK